LLLTLSADMFVALKMITTPSLMCAAAAVTVIWATKVAKREGLVPARVRTNPVKG
jgi:hypothetical protein